MNNIIYKKTIFVGEKRNFLRKYTEFIPELKDIFGDLPTPELNYLIDHKMGLCTCGNRTKFINHENGYKDFCTHCANEIKKLKISEKAKNRKIKGKCPRCGKPSINFAICEECKSKVICIYCKCAVEKDDLSTIITSRRICKTCEYDYYIQSDLKKFCHVNFNTYKKCKECGKLFQYALGGHVNDYCKDHKYKCSVCGKRFKNSQYVKTCSDVCNNKLHQKTYFEKYGCINNLKIKGIKRNDINYWLNKDYTYKESLFQIYLFQGKYKTAFKNLNEFEKYLYDNLHILETFKYKISSNLLVQNYTSLKKLLMIFIKENNIILGNNSFFQKSQTFGTLIKFLYKDELIILRSKKELFFCTLLIKYNILFKTNKLYNIFNNNKMYYDFYLPEYEKYIEITGFMNNEEYRNKMFYKKNKFGSILLNDQKEMKTFIKGLIYEN